MDTIDHYKYRKKQTRLITWTIIAAFIFIVSWTAGIYRHLFGYDPHWAGDNFVFNLAFLFPATIFSTLVCYFTGGLTIINWRRLPSKKVSIVTILLSILLISYVAYSFLMVLRQH